MAQRHSTPIRGLMSTNRSSQFQGRFGRMFRSLPKATLGRTDKENEDNLTLLGFQIQPSKRRLDVDAGGQKISGQDCRPGIWPHTPLDAPARRTKCSPPVQRTIQGARRSRSSSPTESATESRRGWMRTSQANRGYIGRANEIVTKFGCATV